MQSDLSDEDLRSLLSKYMNTVPPVTDTTRHVLLSQLEKFLMEDMQPEVSDNTSIDNLSANALQTSPVKSPRKTPNKQTMIPTIAQDSSESVALTPPQTTAAFASQTTIANAVSGQYNGSSGVSLSFESPSDKSSPIMDYVSRMPTYRRRSIHPDRPGLASPYSDFYLSEAPIAGPNLPPHHSRQQTRRGSMSDKAVAWLRMPVSQAGSSLAALRWCAAGIGNQLQHCPLIRRLSFRGAMWLLIVGLFVLFVTKLLYADPFYRNPVHDLRGMWKSRV